MKILLKLLVFLIVIGFLGLTGYAFLGDMSPRVETSSTPLTLDVD
ncbi:hypothetical protein CLV77_1318 [Brevirhabdus pacifica]|nr:hypothetical protein [Brevirhabdus pacifica]PJJ86761.1 hypothetical protein CLV77_1318 [Brevirhabdus pacifica]